MILAGQLNSKMKKSNTVIRLNKLYRIREQRCRRDYQLAQHALDQQQDVMDTITREQTVIEQQLVSLSHSASIADKIVNDQALTQYLDKLSAIDHKIEAVIGERDRCQVSCDRARHTLMVAHNKVSVIMPWLSKGKRLNE
ncbi:hypothetical protein N9J26_01520 [bacterium]|nr:hypothetical protein [bacterium]